MEKEFAIKHYNWKGQVIGYQQPGAYIPAGVDSHRSREIESKIKNGICELCEPKIP